MSDCLFCRAGVREIDYKRVDLLKLVLKADGTIKARRGKLNKKGKRPGGTGLCRRHQTQVAVAVKRARFMALLPTRRPPKIVEWPPQGPRRRAAT
jgi:small subunit ribosomal protein S18